MKIFQKIPLYIVSFIKYCAVFSYIPPYTSSGIGGETETRTLNALQHNGFQDRPTTNYHISPVPSAWLTQASLNTYYKFQNSIAMASNYQSSYRVFLVPRLRIELRWVDFQSTALTN